MTAKLIYGADFDSATTKLRERLMRPLGLASNALVYLTNMAIAHRVVSEGSLPSETAQALAARDPKILIAWHRYNYLCAHVMRHWPQGCRPTLIMHDGLSSRLLTHESSVWLGFDTFVFARRAALSPRQQIAEYLRRTQRSILLLPDSGGPYGVVKPGVVEIATACAASVWPLAIAQTGALELGKKLRHLLPLPGCHLDLRFGAPIPPESVTQQRCQDALDALEKATNGARSS